MTGAALFTRVDRLDNPAPAEFFVDQPVPLGRRPGGGPGRGRQRPDRFETVRTGFSGGG